MPTDGRRQDAVDATAYEVDEVSSYAELVADLALTYVDERGTGPRLPLVEQIVAGAIALIPGVAAAAVETLDKNGRLTAPVMMGDPRAPRLMEVQNAIGHGPCLDALHDSKQVSVMDLSVDDRWPEFGAAAGAEGMLALVCTPMEVNGRSVGVLVLLSLQVDFGAPDDDTESLARVFAAHAGLALSGARQVGDMHSALSSREVIGQAKGILMERFKMTPDVAFAVLIRASSVTNTKLRTVCEKLCETGVLPSGSAARRSTPSTAATHRWTESEPTG